MTNSYLKIFALHSTLIGTTVLLSVPLSNAQTSNAYTRCQVSEGKAHAFICSRSSYSGSGQAILSLYDDNGSEIDRSRSTVVVVVVMGCDEVITQSVSSNVSGCSLETQFQ